MTIEFDEQLRNRLLAFQQHHGLADDGWAGAKTWHKLVEVAYGEPGKSQTAAVDAQAGKGESPLPMVAAATIKRPKPAGAPDVLTVETIPIAAEKPAPAEGRPRNTTAGDRAKLDAKRERWNPEQPSDRFQADHTRAFSQTPPGAEQKLRNRDAHANMSEGGGQTRRQNQARRQQPDWQDPNSPNYTRPVEKKGGAKAAPSKPAVKAPSDPAVKPPSSPAVKAPGDPAVRPPSNPAAKGPSDPAVKGPGGAGAKALGSKVVGVAGEILTARSAAIDLEWRKTPWDRKWGDTHVDMFGETWYRSPIDPELWTTRPLPDA